MKNRSARPKLNLSRETLKQLEGNLDQIAGGGSLLCGSIRSDCSVGDSCVTCTRPLSLCNC